MTTTEPPKTDNGDFPVVITHYISEVEASSDMAALQSVGIDARMLGNFSTDGLNYYGLAVRKVELAVPSRQAKQAVEFLKELSSSTPRERQADWTCSDCNEINGREFDACWSCGKTWTADDRVYEADNLAQPLPSADARFPAITFPDLDSNPYAAPVTESVVVATSGEDMEELIRRARTGTIMCFAFPPLLLLVVFMAVHGLMQANSGQLQASSQQIRRLTTIAVIAGALIAPFALFFAVILGALRF